MKLRVFVLMVGSVACCAALYFAWGMSRGGAASVALPQAERAMAEGPKTGADLEGIPAPVRATTEPAAAEAEGGAGAPEPQPIVPATTRVQLTCATPGAREALRARRMPFVVFLRSGPALREVLYRGRTEGDGTALFDLSLPAGLADELRVAPDEKGLQSWAAALQPAPADADFDYLCRMKVVLGATVLGALVSEDGRGAQGEVGVLTGGAGSSWARSTRSRSDGGFDLHLQEALVRKLREGGAWALTAHAPGIGTGWRHEQGLEDDHPLLARTLQMVGQAELRGRLVDAAGSALPGVEIRVGSHEELGDATTGRGALGLRETKVVSGADGRFAASGLAPGRYDIDATLAEGWRVIAETGSGHMRAARNREWAPLSEVPVAADGIERDYVLDARLLIVSLLRADGEVYMGEVDQWRNGRGRDRDVVGIPRWPRLRVRAGTFDGKQVELRRLNDGRFVGIVSGLETAALSVFGVGAAGEGFAPLETMVSLQGETSIVEVSVSAEAPAPFGRLEIDAWVTPRLPEPFHAPVLVQATTGDRSSVDPAPPGNDRLALGPREEWKSGQRIVLFDARTKREVLEFGQGNVYGPEPSVIPAGDYLVRITPTHDFGHAPFGGASQAVTVRRGETTRVSFEIGPGATLRLAFDAAEGRFGPFYLEDGEGVRFDVLGPAPPMRPFDSSFPAPSVTFPAGSETETLPLPAGTFRLRGSIGSREIDLRLRLQDGECLDVRL